MIFQLLLSSLYSGFYIMSGPVGEASSSRISQETTYLSGWSSYGVEVSNTDYINVDNSKLPYVVNFSGTNTLTLCVDNYTLGTLRAVTDTSNNITAIRLDFNDGYLVNYKVSCHFTLYNFVYPQVTTLYNFGGVYDLYDINNNSEIFYKEDIAPTLTNLQLQFSSLAFTFDFIEQDYELCSTYDNRDSDIQQAFDNGVQQGYMDYKDSGEYQDYITEVWHDGYDEGRDYGWQEGYDEALTQDIQTATVFNGILSIALLPINVFLGMMNFEVFGINVGGFVSGLLTIAIIFILFRTIFNGGSKDAD